MFYGQPIIHKISLARLNLACINWSRMHVNDNARHLLMMMASFNLTSCVATIFRFNTRFWFVCRHFSSGYIFDWPVLEAVHDTISHATSCATCLVKNTHKICEYSLLRAGDPRKQIHENFGFVICSITVKLYNII